MTLMPAFPSPCFLSPYRPSSTWPCLFPVLLAHPPFSLLSQIPSPFPHCFPHYPFLKIACLLLCSRRKVLNLWSLHLKTFLTFSSPLLSSLGWFPTLRGFIAYVTNDERVLFVCFNLSSGRHTVNDVVFHIMTLIPTPCVHRMTFTPFIPVYSFIKPSPRAPWTHAEPRALVPNHGPEHLGSLSFILPITLRGPAASALCCVLRYHCSPLVCSRCAARSLPGFKNSNEFLWYVAVMTHFYGFFTIFVNNWCPLAARILQGRFFSVFYRFIVQLYLFLGAFFFLHIFIFF